MTRRRRLVEFGGEGESQMITRLGVVLYWFGLMIASLCEIAALTILAAIITHKLSDSEAWMAAVFFAVVGGFSWLAGRAAKSAFTGI